jgi:hypothetical protein
MRRKGRTIEGDVLGKPLLTFSKELTMKAVKELSAKITHMEDIYAAVDKLLSDGHIKSVVQHAEALQKIYAKYQDDLFMARRDTK